MLKVNLPKRILLLLSTLFIVFGFGSVVYAQEDTVTTNQSESSIIDVSDYKVSDYSSEQALLFVQDSSEVSQDLLEYIDTYKDINTEIFKLYVVTVPTQGDVFNEFKSVFEAKCDIEKLVVPVMIYRDVCVIGIEDISYDVASRFGIEAQNVQLKDSIAENVEVFNEIAQEYNEEVESKTFLDWVKELDTFTLVVSVVGILLVITSIVLLIVFRKKLLGRNKVVGSIAPVLIMVASVGFMLFKVNDVKNSFAPLDSSASCLDSNSCATYADLVEARSQSSNSEVKRKAEKAKKQMKIDEERFGSNASHLQTSAPANNTLLSEVYKLKNGETITIDGKTYTYNENTGDFMLGNTRVSVSDVFKNATVGQSITGSNNTIISSQSINQYVTSTGDTKVGEELKESLLGNLNGVDGYCLKNGVVVSCEVCGEGYSGCVFNQSTDVALRYDNITGSAVLVPTGKAIVDECEGGTGNNVYGPIRCDCGNGIWTTAYSGTCDVICRVEDLICDDCNPEEPTQPPPPPTGGPYCGDSILGNTTGEECEYGDPSGVSCSWNSCDPSSCTCPEDTDPYCGDGVVNNEFEECELGDPSGTSCTWDNCNHVNCKCITPGCGDGNLDSGELCERGNPSGVSCLWDTECNQLTCDCKIEKSASCGDGTLDDGEYCESGNPSGSLCDWSLCSKYSCTCPSKSKGNAPQTGIFDNTESKLIAGFALIVLGMLLTPMTRVLSNYYVKVGGGLLKLGKYVQESNMDNRRKNFEEKIVKK